MATHHVLGRNAEKAAAAYLEKSGYRILETNWRHQHLEVDIIALDGPWLVIVEVKARTTEAYGHPSEFISRRKERNLIEAADYFVTTRGLQHEVRFDVITLLRREKDWELEHFPDAFNAYS